MRLHIHLMLMCQCRPALFHTKMTHMYSQRFMYNTSHFSQIPPVIQRMQSQLWCNLEEGCTVSAACPVIMRNAPAVRGSTSD